MLAHKRSAKTDSVKQPRCSITKEISKPVVSAVITIASMRPWEMVSYAEIAESSGVSVDDITSVFPKKIDIVSCIVKQLDDDILEKASFDPELDFKEQLFELLMERFDVMNNSRDAHISFIKSFGWVNHHIPEEINLYYSTLWSYWVFCKKSGGAKENLDQFDLEFVIYAVRYLNVLRIWSLDRSQDMGKTMAALSKL